jgi:hypothetical protein
LGSKHDNAHGDSKWLLLSSCTTMAADFSALLWATNAPVDCYIFMKSSVSREAGDTNAKVRVFTNRTYHFQFMVS